MVAVGKQPDGTYVIQNPDKTYSRVSANDPRVPKMTSETVRPTLSFPSNNKGVDMWIGANYSPRFDAASAKLGMNPLNWPKYISDSYWDSNIHKAIHEGNNLTAGVVATPFTAALAAETAPVWAPWLSQKALPFVVKHFLAPTAAGIAWDEAQRAITGTTTTEQISNYLQKKGWNPTVSEFVGGLFNPGYWINFGGTGQYTRPLFNKIGLGVSSSSVALTPELSAKLFPRKTFSERVTNAVNTTRSGIQSGQRAYNIFRLSRELNKAANSFDGTVGTNYFRSPSNWYRVTESPEIMDIKYQGKNVTTRDISSYDSPSNDFRNFVIQNKLKPGIGENEGYWVMPRKKSMIILTKSGSAHGNTSQAAKGEIWGGTFAKSNRFPTYIIEGEGPIEVFRGFNPTTGTDSRTNFVKVPWEEVPFGARIGFHTGEMPMEGLRAFRSLPNGRYQYEGSILPERIIRIDNPSLSQLNPQNTPKN